MRRTENKILTLSAALFLGVAIAAPTVASSIASSVVWAEGIRGCEGLFLPLRRDFLSGRTDVQVFSMSPKLIRAGRTRSIENYAATLRRLRTAVETVGPSTEVTETMAYPMSGFDLAAALRLFPTTRTYLLIDNHSLIVAETLEAVRKQKIESLPVDRNGSYVDANETGNVFEKLITSLFATIPEAKVTDVKFILDQRGNVSLKLDFVDPSTGLEKTVYYLAGELGEMTEKASMSGSWTRSYLTNVRANARERANSNEIARTENWWDELLTELAPRALLVKGSMSALRQTRYETQIAGRERLIAPILARGGVVVEGASRLSETFDANWAKKLKVKRDRWELTDGDPRFSRPAKVEILSGVDFSYTDVVKVSLHRPTTPRVAGPRLTPRVQSPSGF